VKIKEKNNLSRYGVLDVEPVEKNIYKIKKIVEKPDPKDAPSDLAALGAYILLPEIFDVIKKLNPGKGGEIWLVDAINELIKRGFPVYACEINQGKYYDTGNKLEYMKTVTEFALTHPDISKDFKKYLKSLGL
ncbi:MAG: UTP--glucose-1-phosphate uridylyltransferase, partial [Parcubacteria group bacterium]